jgi:hypothetical protein
LVLTTGKQEDSFNNIYKKELCSCMFLALLKEPSTTVRAMQSRMWGRMITSSGKGGEEIAKNAIIYLYLVDRQALLQLLGPTQ